MDCTDYKTALWGFSWEDIYEESDCIEQGVANLTEDGITLEIPFGELLGSRGVVVVGASAKPSDVDYLYGFSQSGDHLVLKNASLAGMSTSYPGGTSQVINAQHLFAGRSQFDPNANIELIYMTLEGLSEWVREMPFVTEWGTNPSEFHAIKYDYENKDSYNRTLLDDSDRTIELFHAFSVSPLNADGVGIKHNCQLKVSFKKATSFENAMKTASGLSQFLSYCLGYYAEIKELCLMFSGSESLVKCHSRFLRGFEPSREAKQRIPLHLNDIEDVIDGALSYWLDMGRGASEACSITTSLLTQNWDLPIDLRFVAAAQALEALSKIGTDVSALPAEEYESLKDIVKSSVADTEARKWISDRMPGNTKGQKSLLKDLFSRNQELLNWLIEDESKFLAQHIAARNYYTHRNNDSTIGNAPLEGESLFWHTEIVLLINYGFIGSALGLKTNSFTGCLEKSRYKESVVRKAREVYAASEHRG